MGRNTTFKRTVFAHAVLLAIAATVSTGAMAQSNATGNIFGQAKSGETVLIESDTGVKRTIAPDSNGRFQALSLPTGNYKVSLQKGGAVVSSKNVEVLIGQGSEVSFATLDAVVVTGQARKLDVTTANAGNVFTGPCVCESGNQIKNHSQCQSDQCGKRTQGENCHQKRQNEFHDSPCA